MTFVRIKPRKNKKGTTYHVCIVRRVEQREQWETVWSGTSKEEAKAKRKKILKRLQNDRAGLVEGNPTLGEALDDYRDHLEGRASHRSVKSYLSQHFGHDLRMVRLDALTTAHVDAWQQAMRAKGLHPQTEIHGLGYLKAAINRALTERKWEGANVLDAIKPPRKPRGVVEILEPAEVARALPFYTASDRALVGSTFELIWRFGEAANLEKDRDVDLERRRITIRGAHGRKTKTGDTRVLPITDRALPWIRLAIETSGDSIYLFPGPNGERQREDRKLARMLRWGLSQAGIVIAWDLKCRRRTCAFRSAHGRQYVERTTTDEEQKCPHCNMRLWPSPIPRPVDFRSLRNAGATRMILDGVPEAVVKDMLGHDSFEMLKRHYFQANPDRMRQVIDGKNGNRAGTKLRRAK